MGNEKMSLTITHTLIDATYKCKRKQEWESKLWSNTDQQKQRQKHRVHECCDKKRDIIIIIP